MLGPLPTPLGHHCHRDAGFIADVALAPLPLSPLQRWHHCNAGIIADVALVPLGHRCRCGAGVITNVALAPSPLLPSRRWNHCGCCPGTAWALLPSWCWRHRGQCPGAVAIVAVAALASSRRAGVIAAVALAPLGHRCLCSAGIIADVALRLCHHCCRGAGLTAALVSSRPSTWHHLGIIAVTALASSWTSP